MDYGVETFGSSFPGQNRRFLSMNPGRLNTLWWIALGLTATIIGAGVFWFLVQSSDKPQDVIVEMIPVKPVSPEKVSPVPAPTTASPITQDTNLFDVPETLFSPPVTSKSPTPKPEKTEVNTVLPVVESRPSVEVKPEKKKTKAKIVEQKRQEENPPSVISQKVVLPAKTTMSQSINILASMDRQDNNLLNNAFEKIRSNLFYAWDNRLSGYTYELVLRPAYSNNSGAPCRNATLKAWKEPQNRNTVYQQQNISACRALQQPRWHIK